ILVLKTRGAGVVPELPERPMSDIGVAINQHVFLPFSKCCYSFRERFCAVASPSVPRIARYPHLGRSYCHIQTTSGLPLYIPWHTQTCHPHCCCLRHPRKHSVGPSPLCRHSANQFP